uniref:Cytochrome P450, family 2, subfamily U, polypeptide 1 n=1 Tax=Sander lucioperca TaxID=283035 RepID=A0A8D0CPJ5_SANLU
MVSLSWLESLSGAELSHVHITLLVFLLVFYTVKVINQNRRDLANIPPGPKPWPLVGNFGGFLIPSFIRQRFGQQSDGSQLMVVLNGYEVVKDALSNHSKVFSDRPDIPAFLCGGLRSPGIVFAPYGPVWKKQRKFCHATLRNFGLGKLSLEPCILRGLATVKTELMRLNEGSGAAGVDLAPLIRNAVSNVICSLILGQSFHHEDRQFRNMLDLMDRGLEISVNSPAVLINIFPLLYYFPFGVFKELRQVEGDITVFLKRVIANHRETFNPDHPRDLVDMYLKEISVQEDSSFTEDYLFYIIGDLFIAGTDTTANSILWILLYMVLHPDIQGKCNRVQAEIDEVVGTHRDPSMTDKGSLPFTEATIMEVQRLTVAVPLAIPHMASKTTEFRGYTIPKGTVIVPNLWSVHRDPTLWDDPRQFQPRTMLHTIRDWVCMGEQLAKMELFLAVSSLLQAFRFRLPEGTPPPTLNGRFGLTLAPCPYTVCVHPRR